MDFGAFVAITPNKDGLVHISQISEERVKDVKDVLSEGDVVKVKVLEVWQGHLNSFSGFKEAIKYLEMRHR